MGLKIVWQDLFEEAIAPNGMIPRADMLAIREGLKQAANKLARPDTEVVFSYVSKWLPGNQFPFMETLNDMMIASAIVAAQKQGCDAAMIGVGRDCGLQMVRGAVDIPVTGALEAGVLMAQMLGLRFALVLDSPLWIPSSEAYLRRYANERRMIQNKPVRSVGASGQSVASIITAIADAYRDKPQALISLFEAEALKCIEDGADVIVAGCGYFGPALSLHGYHEVGTTGVPVVDASCSALKFAEVLADFRKATGLTKSKAANSPYKTPPAEYLELVRAVLHL